MSLSSLFYDHPLIFGCSLFLAGLSSGIAVEKFFSDRVNQIENVSKQELSTDVLQLQDTVNSQHQSIQVLTSELSAARDELSNRGNQIGSNGLSLQVWKQKYATLSNDYEKLSGWYTSLSANYRLAQNNCNVLSKINELERQAKHLDNQLRSVDVFDRDIEGTKRDIRAQMQQNHERLINLQSKLSCS